jgi:hypothetical protein
MANADLTRREQSLGEQDSITGWYAPSYAETTIEGSIQPKGAAFPTLNIGAYARYPHTLFTADVIRVGDEVKDANEEYYIVKSADQFWWLDQFSHYQCELEKRSPYAQPPTTSGTWHLDSSSLKTDARYRTKLWLETYLTAANMKLDNGSTNASTIISFDHPPYYCPISQVFLTKNVDGIFSIGKEPVQALYTHDHYPYAFIESVPISCYTVNKAGLTATNLLEQMEQEIRHVATDHPLGSIRSIEVIRHPTPENIGGVMLYSSTVTIHYLRANDDYMPTTPSIAYSSAGAGPYTYIMPNCIEFTIVGETTDEYTHPIGFIGNLPYLNGDNSLEFIFKIDLDVEPTNLTHKRPQTTSPKTDSVSYQIWLDIKHNHAVTDEYLLLNVGWGSTIKARLVNVRPENTPDGHTVTLTFKEYRSTSASAETYKQRFGIT